MKLLIATDYSDHAGVALQYAIDTSCTTDAALHVLHVHNNYIDDDIDLIIEERAFEQAEKKMTQLMTGVLPLLNNNHVPQFSVIAGDIKNEITKYIKEENIDLLIVGTEGKNSLNNVLFGSTTRALLRSVDIPMLVIPNIQYDSLKSKNILLALDKKEVSDENIFRIPNTIAKAYGMTYNILHVNKENEKDFPFDPFVLSYLDAPLSEIELYENKSVIDGINFYAANHNNTGLIIMIKRNEGFIKSLFSKSLTSKEIFNTHTPLLIIKN